jgi:hypothetical protein
LTRPWEQKVEKNLKGPAFYLNEAGLFYSGASVIPRSKNNSENSDYCCHTPYVFILDSFSNCWGGVLEAQTKKLWYPRISF